MSLLYTQYDPRTCTWLQSDSIYIRDLERPSVINLIHLALRCLNCQDPILVNAPLKVRHRITVTRRKQCNGVTLLDRKHRPTHVDDNETVGRFVEGDDTKCFGRGQESI